jgi:hypothetical protein
VAKIVKAVVAVAIVIGIVAAPRGAQAAQISPAEAGLNWKAHKGYTALVSDVKFAHESCFNSTLSEVNFNWYHSEGVDGAFWVYCD